MLRILPIVLMCVALISSICSHLLTLPQYDQSLQSASLELKYERSTHLVDIISKDENLRKMRFDMHRIEDDNEELRDLLTQEEDRSKSLEKLVNDNLVRAEEAEAHVVELEQDLQAAEQELSVLRVRMPNCCRVMALTVA